MDIKKIYLTKEGLEQLKKEYTELAKVKRPEVVERVAQARSLGDLSENAEYVAAKEELNFMDGRIEELEEIIRQAIQIKEDHHSKKVQLGSRVLLTVGKKKEIFTLVGEWEADPIEKKISHESPLGKALLGRAIGEKVQVQAPAGVLHYSIEDIQ